MDDLHEVTREPTFLEKMGFVRREDGTSDVVRWVWYERTIDSIESQVRLIIQVEFELSISDNPFVPTIDNFSYSFNRVYLRVIDRQMERWDNQSYDEETERPREIDRFEINVATLSQLRALWTMPSLKD